MSTKLDQKIEIKFKTNYKQVLKNLDSVQNKIKKIKTLSNQGFSVKMKNYSSVIGKLRKISQKSKIKGTVDVKVKGYSSAISKLSKLKTKSKIKGSVTMTTKGTNISGGGTSGGFSKVSGVVGKAGVVGGAIAGGLKAANIFQDQNNLQDVVQAKFFKDRSVEKGRSSSNYFIKQIDKLSRQTGVQSDILLTIAKVLKDSGDKNWGDSSTISKIALSSKVNDFDITSYIDVLNNVKNKEGKTVDKNISIGLIEELKNTVGDNRQDLIDTLQEYSNLNQQNGIDFYSFINILKEGKSSGAFNFDKVGDIVKEMMIRVGDNMNNNPQIFNKLGIAVDTPSDKYGGKTLKQAYNEGDISNMDVLRLMDEKFKNMSENKKQPLMSQFLGTMSEDIGYQTSQNILNTLIKGVDQQQVNEYKNIGIKNVGKQQEIFSNNDNNFRILDKATSEFKWGLRGIYNTYEDFFNGEAAQERKKTNELLKKLVDNTSNKTSINKTNKGINPITGLNGDYYSQQINNTKFNK